MVKLSMEAEGQAQVAVSVPLFLKKLWKMVNDKEAEEIIGWNSAGDGFVIYDQLQFITKLLPQYFKHNNMASFIRQLNFYDFHKIAGIDKDEMHFAHNCFLKDLPETLVFIKRKCTSMKSKLTNNVTDEELSQILNGVKELKTKHSLVDNELKLLRQENAALWSEINSLRVKHSKQTKIINKIIHFLISYIHSQNSLAKRNGVTRKSSQKNLKTGPTILEIDYHDNHADVPKPAKQNSYTVPETSGAIAYNVEKQNMSNVQPTVNYSIDEISYPTLPTSQDKTLPSGKLVKANASGNLKVNTLRSSKANALNVLKANTLGNSKAVISETPKDNTLENPILNVTNSNADMVGSAIPTMSNSKNNNLEIKKELENLNDLGLYFYNSQSPAPLPLKSPVEHNKILVNPKENLGLYLDSTQMELNSLQDILNNLSSDELSDICNLMETVEPEPEPEPNTAVLDTAELDDVDQMIESDRAVPAEGDNEEYVSKGTSADELVILPFESNLSEGNNLESDQFSQDNIPEVLVDEYFNEEF